MQDTYLHAGRAGRELGWTAQAPLAEGLARTVEDFGRMKDERRRMKDEEGLLAEDIARPMTV